MFYFKFIFIILSLASFSVGDELGLPESLGNLEGERRRSVNYKHAPNDIGVVPAANLPNSIPNKSTTSAQKSSPSKGLSSSSGRSYFKTPPVALMTQAASLPLGVPAFRPIPYPLERPENIRRNLLLMQPQNPKVAINNKVIQPSPYKLIDRNYPTNVAPSIQMSMPKAIPPFQSIPQSVSRISTGQTVEIESNQFPTSDDELINYPKVDLKGHTVEELAQAANVSVDIIKGAIALRQQQLIKDYQAFLQNQKQNNQKKQSDDTKDAPFLPTPIPTSTSSPTKTTTTTFTPRNSKNGQKVMNAPKEYYPVGYEKNFDDNFESKVDLPSTSFNCGEQKHFPGLYGDMDLGCMVFHVCALTDDGLIMKSFLCPESTLFDQTILKCNWWFYVECKNSKNNYDSNIPVSKSYQLMKSLTYFANYSKNNTSSNESEVNMEALKNTVLDPEPPKTT
ncbi:uncharacterized protein LOC129613053 isoform X2 [Condylostylus longicornis]|uniref:uncharacterized protein LOC129613053 isoform X2 n=1 Tax=Condylostylus longicornis TaxID=2530218 RepID=UPI00244E0DA9|nr:uncharacterized protein LOC129613053 isoform X2 [Condylostylus longicornis]